MEKMIIIILIISLIIILSRIRIVVLKNINEKLNIKAYIIPKLGIKINLNKYFDKFKNQSFSSILSMIKLEIENANSKKKLLFDFLNIIRIRKIKINYFYDYLQYPSLYIYIFGWYSLSYQKNFLDKHVKRVDKEEYNLVISSDINDAYMYVDLVFPIISFIFILIKNFKVIIKGIIKHGTSNKRTIKAFRRKYY